MLVTDKKRNILVVDDEPQITRVLMTTLTSHGYTIRLAADGDEALQVMKDWPPDLLITDLSMPNMDGLQLCRNVRTRSTIPIIVLSVRGEDQAKIEALDAGADDYLVKPFGLAELQARIRAVLRRVRPGGDVIRHGPLAVDIRTHRVTVAGQEVSLTPKEFDILECLATDPGRVVSRQEILETAWDAHWYGPTKVLDVHVAALRRKLGAPGLIETVYGRGFRLGEA